MNRFFRTLFLVVIFSLPGLVSAEEEYWEYTLRPGDSIWSIAKRFTTSVNNWAELEKLNQARQGSSQKLLAGTRIVIPVSMLKLQPSPALVIAIKGGAKLTRANGESAEVTTDTKLHSGDKIVTADGQSLRLQFADKSELQVLPNSEVILDKLSHHKDSGMVDTRIRLNSGSVDTWVEKLTPDSRYEIVTPAAVTAVRGTAFRLSADGTLISRTEVIEGIVGVSAGDANKNIEHGYGIVAEKDKPLPAPVKLLPAPEISDNLFADKSELHITWDKLDGAKYYRYQLATDEKFNQIVVDSTTMNNALQLTELEVRDYHLRVRGVDRFKLEGLDGVRQVEVKPVQPFEDDSYWKVVISIGLLILISF